MSLRISGKNMDIGEAMRGHVHEKITGMAARLFDGTLNGHVVVEPEGSGYRADCMLHLSSGVTIAADGKAQEAYAAFDQAAERVEKRLRRYKTRLKDHHQGKGEPSAPPELFAEHVIEAPHEDVDDSKEFSPVIIAETHARLKTCAVAGAVMELDVTGANVMVFRHAGSGRVNLVYRRRDGNIGWIDPAQEKSGATP